jgi:aspartate carbamoyltransferase catalytic subunit
MIAKASLDPPAYNPPSTLAMRRPIPPGFMRSNPQLTRQGTLKHLLSIEGLPRTLLCHLLDSVARYAAEGAHSNVLSARVVCNLFFERAACTRASFETAAKRLGAAVLNLDSIAGLPVDGTHMLDILADQNVTAAEIMVVRHPQSGAPFLFAEHCPPHMHVINAGDGCHAHPTQALLDMYTLRCFRPEMRGLIVAVVGDVLHTPAARSNIHALSTLGVPEIRVIGPSTLLSEGLEQLGVKVFHKIEDGLRDVDVIIVLRSRSLSWSGARLPSADAYFARYRLTQDRLALAAPHAIVMRSGAIQRGLEIDAEVLDGTQCPNSDQFAAAIAVRMAVMSLMTGAK